MEKTVIDNIHSAGVGLRMPHIDEILNRREDFPWLELMADNWFCESGLTGYYLDAVSEKFPLSVHGVGLSLGSIDPLDLVYLEKVKSLLNRSSAIAYSEHLSFSSVAGKFIPDLLPLPYTEEALNHVAMRVNAIQDFLQRQLIIENISSYLSFEENTLRETEFLKYLVEKTGCGLLLDINNLYVNQVNLGRDAIKALDDIPFEAVKEIHLAGFEDKQAYLVDAHNNPVSDEVWSLYETCLQRSGPVATLIEWDNDLPALQVLVDEQQKAQKILDAACVRAQVA
jgi:uncharacterized protein (UPF0276 family)